MVQIIVKDRSRLVRQQKAVIDYVHKKDNPSDTKVQEAVKDFQRWSNESGIYKGNKIDDDGKPMDKSIKWVTTFERKERRKNVLQEETS